MIFVETERLALTAAGGDQDALAALFDHYRPVVLRYVRARVDNPHLAEDLAGDVWVKVTSAIGRYKSHGPGSFLGWTLTIAQRCIISEWRKTRDRPQTVSATHAQDWADEAPGPLEEVELGEQVLEVTLAVLALSEQQQECVRLRFYEDLSIAETASRMNRASGAVKGLQHRAVRAMKQSMTEPPDSTESRGSSASGDD